MQNKRVRGAVPLCPHTSCVYVPAPCWVHGRRPTAGMEAGMRLTRPPGLLRDQASAMARATAVRPGPFCRSSPPPRILVIASSHVRKTVCSAGTLSESARTQKPGAGGAESKSPRPMLCARHAAGPGARSQPPRIPSLPSDTHAHRQATERGRIAGRSHLRGNQGVRPRIEGREGCGQVELTPQIRPRNPRGAGGTSTRGVEGAPIRNLFPPHPPARRPPHPHRGRG